MLRRGREDEASSPAMPNPASCSHVIVVPGGEHNGVLLSFSWLRLAPRASLRAPRRLAHAVGKRHSLRWRELRMPTDQPGYQSFRQRLDTVLRRKDPAALSAFLITEGQWQPGDASRAEFAMWMMIAASPALTDLHEQARQWLVSHGHEAEAQAITGRGGRGERDGEQQARKRPGSGGKNRRADTSSRGRAQSTPRRP